MKITGTKTLFIDRYLFVALEHGHLGRGDGLARPDEPALRLRRRVVGAVLEQVGAHRSAGTDDLTQQLQPHRLAVAQVRRGDEALQVKLVIQTVKSQA